MDPGIYPKHQGPYPRFNVDMDPFPKLGIRRGGQQDMYGDICSQHQEPYSYSNIPVDMDLFPELGVWVQGGEHHKVYGDICPALSAFKYRLNIKYIVFPRI